jgi:hypothetical protein
VGGAFPAREDKKPGHSPGFVAFRGNLCGVSEHCPSETPYIQHRHCGALIAPHVRVEQHVKTNRQAEWEYVLGNMTHSACLFCGRKGRSVENMVKAWAGEKSRGNN